MISNITDSHESGHDAHAPVVTLIDQLLSDQQKLYTPIVEIADKIDAGEIRTDTYKHLIPLSKPTEGQQYAFQVELDKCTSCKACVAACHSLNGLEEEEAWRDVGHLHGGEAEPAWQQTVTTACHHCLEPECMHGCPVGAYEKDADTGIVRHLDDQCIGCEYCSLKCPYDVPKYSSRLGIVRKCDMCYQRLEVGEAPACVQACPNEAIKIINVEQEKLRPILEQKRGFLNGAPLPNITLPTTQYVGREVPKTAKPADQEKLIPAAKHTPLVLMLTLTQAGVGALIGAALNVSPTQSIIGSLMFFVGLSCSIIHLGRPLGAWRFFLGLKTSWLSREILAFSVFTLLALLSPIALSLVFYDIEGFVNLPVASFFARALYPFLGWGVTIIGLISVFTSVMIYHDTKRDNWHLKFTIPAFFGTTFAFTGLLLAQVAPFWSLLLAIPIIADLILLAPAIKEKPWTPALHRARLMWHPLRKITIARFLCGILALVICPFSIYVALPLLIAGEVLSRSLYFRAVHSPKMTGSF